MGSEMCIRDRHFGMKAHIGTDDDSGLVHSLTGTAANVEDITESEHLLHGDETEAYTDAGYTGVAKHAEFQGSDVVWHLAEKRGKLKLCAAWRNRMGFFGIDNVSTAELNEHLRADVFVCIFHNRRVSNPDLFASTVYVNGVLVGRGYFANSFLMCGATTRFT